MGVIILAVSFILLFLCTIHLAPKAGLGGLRNAFLITCVLWTLLMFVGSELLSLPHWVNFWGLLGYWLLISIVLGIYLRRINFSLSWSIIPKIKFSRFEKVLLSVVGLILGVTLFIGLYSPPNNPDSMVYHMARVAHWMQNQSVQHYATQIEMQICAQPLSELIILHFQVLSGSDHFASIMQWFSLFASLVGLSLITKIMGGNKKSQILTVFVGVTIPMAILQASSTQNDLAVSFWVIAFSYFIILSIKRPHILVSLLAGSSLGLALLTKGTGYIFASPLVLVYGWVVVYKLIKLRNEAFLLIKYGLVISIIAVLLNSIHYQRNYSLYNHPFGMIPWLKLNNELHSVPALISNVERNMVLHISSFYKPVSNKINKFLKNSHQRIGLKISDRRTTYYGSWALPRTIRLSDDSTRNLAHTLLILILVFIPLALPRFWNDKFLIAYSAVLIAGFLLFCFLLKWQPWHSRLHTPLFLLSSSLIAILLAGTSRKLLYPIILILFLQALPVLLVNRTRALLPMRKIIKSHRNAFIKLGIPRNQLQIYSMLGGKRENLYFKAKQKFVKVYKPAVTFVKERQFHEIGLYLTSGDWDYPFYQMLKTDYAPVRIEHVGVRNRSRVLMDTTFSPDCILSTRQHKGTLNINRDQYRWVEKEGRISIFVKEPEPILLKDDQ